MRIGLLDSKAQTSSISWLALPPTWRYPNCSPYSTKWSLTAVVVARRRNGRPAGWIWISSYSGMRWGNLRVPSCRVLISCAGLSCSGRLPKSPRRSVSPRQVKLSRSSGLSSIEVVMTYAPLPLPGRCRLNNHRRIGRRPPLEFGRSRKGRPWRKTGPRARCQSASPCASMPCGRESALADPNPCPPQAT